MENIGKIGEWFFSNVLWELLVILLFIPVIVFIKDIKVTIYLLVHNRTSKRPNFLIDRFMIIGLGGNITTPLAPDSHLLNSTLQRNIDNTLLSLKVVEENEKGKLIVVNKRIYNVLYYFYKQK